MDTSPTECRPVLSRVSRVSIRRPPIFLSLSRYPHEPRAHRRDCLWLLHPTSWQCTRIHKRIWLLRLGIKPSAIIFSRHTKALHTGAIIQDRFSDIRSTCLWCSCEQNYVPRWPGSRINRYHWRFKSRRSLVQVHALAHVCGWPRGSRENTKRLCNWLSW